MTSLCIISSKNESTREVFHTVEQNNCMSSEQGQTILNFPSEHTLHNNLYTDSYCEDIQSQQENNNSNDIDITDNLVEYAYDANIINTPNESNFDESMHQDNYKRNVGYTNAPKSAFINVCGLKSKLLCIEFHDFVSSFDMIGLAETKLHGSDIKGDSIDTTSIPGYTCFHKVRKSQRGNVSGGNCSVC